MRFIFILLLACLAAVNAVPIHSGCSPAGREYIIRLQREAERLRCIHNVNCLATVDPEFKKGAGYIEIATSYLETAAGPRATFQLIPNSGVGTNGVGQAQFFEFFPTFKGPIARTTVKIHPNGTISSHSVLLEAQEIEDQKHSSSSLQKRHPNNPFEALKDVYVEGVPAKLNEIGEEIPPIWEKIETEVPKTFETLKKEIPKALETLKKIIWPRSEKDLLNQDPREQDPWEQGPTEALKGIVKALSLPYDIKNAKAKLEVPPGLEHLLDEESERKKPAHEQTPKSWIEKAKSDLDRQKFFRFTDIKEAMITAESTYHKGKGGEYVPAWEFEIHSGFHYYVIYIDAATNSQILSSDDLTISC